MVTGLYPDDHGIISNHFFDPVWNATYSISDPSAVTDGRWYGGEPFWVTVENHGWLVCGGEGEEEGEEKAGTRKERRDGRDRRERKGGRGGGEEATSPGIFSSEAS
jgi:hypothetical protein